MWGRHLSPRVQRALPGLLLCLSLGCTPSLPIQPLGGDRSPFWIDGCVELRQGTLCELEPSRKLTLWMSARREPLEIRVDGKEVKTKQQEVHEGLRIDLVLPKGAKKLVVHSKSGRHGLTLLGRKEYPQLDEADRLRESGKLEEAATKLAALATSKSAELRVRALSRGARLEMQRGNYRKAVEILQTSSRQARAAGLAVQAVKELFTLAYIQTHYLFELTKAEQTLKRVQPQLASQRGWLNFHQSALSHMQGNLRAALVYSQEAALLGRRLANHRLQVMSKEAELMVLGELGRLEEARKLGSALERLVSDDPCLKASVLTNLAWIELVASGGDYARAGEYSRLAAELCATSCPDPFLHQNTLVNLSLSSFRREAFLDSKTQLERAAKLGPLAGWVRAWGLELEGRLALAAGKGQDALKIFRQLEENAELASLLSGRYRAAVGMGLAFKQTGDPLAAIAEFEKAEKYLDRDARLVPLTEGRDLFVGSRDESIRELLETLLNKGRFADALHAARLARVRALRTLSMRAQIGVLEGELRSRWLEAAGRYKAARKRLEESDKKAWEIPHTMREAFGQRQKQEHLRVERILDEAHQLLPATAAEELLPPGPGELMLMYHPLTEGWVAFGATASKVLAKRIIAPKNIADLAGLSDLLLQPFAQAIEQAKRIKVLPYGALKRVPFHGLPWRDKTLLDHKPVVYGVDSGPGTSRQGFERSVAVVADPRSDLLAARQEGQLFVTRNRVPDSGQLFGPRATRDAVSNLLQQTRLVHFAGHAAADGLGFQSRMLLADGTALKAGDILMLPNVPHAVVLSGCETTREASDAPVASVGLAQAFLIRGTQVAIAAIKPVRDTAGLALAKRLYANPGMPLTPELFSQALLDLRQNGDDSWLAYRMLVP